MKILVVADSENNEIWSNWHQGWAKRLADIDLILSAGDLAPAYLEFLVTMLNVPLLYVRGNHDSIYDTDPPEGCIDIDCRAFETGGLRIAGLGGSMRYRDGGDMYTEKEMADRIRRLKKSLRKESVRRSLKRMFSAAESKASCHKPFDILLTHAPCLGYGDMEDLPHTGFDCFNSLLDEYRPKFHLYGHIHMEYGNFRREILHPSGTRLINCSGYYVLEI